MCVSAWVKRFSPPVNMVKKKGENEEDEVFNETRTLNDFKLMKIECLQEFLALRKKPTDGDFDTLVSRWLF